jgi:hypothetical protein
LESGRERLARRRRFATDANPNAYETLIPAADVRKDSACLRPTTAASGGSFEGLNSTRGTVTETEFGRTKIRKASLGSGCGGGSPRPERFHSEDAERTTGCEMTLDVKSVVDGGVKRQEALG